MLVRSYISAAMLAVVVAIAPIIRTLAAGPELEISELHDQGSIRRDGNGVPHISATDEHDLMLLQGWAHARDRLFQMDVLRRQASGTLAELVGRAALGSDVELRTIGLRRAAEKSLSALSAEAQAGLAAYAAGVNAYAGNNPLPPEYTPLKRTFEPWTALDSLVVAKLIAFSLSFDLDIAPTVRLATYVATGNALGFDGAALYFEDTHRVMPFDPAATVPDAGGASTVDLVGRGLLRLQSMAALEPALALGRRYLDRVGGLSLFHDALEPGRRRSGSNEWVVSGRHTRNGLPVIANDPHLTLTAPAIFYPNHLVAPAAGFDVSGESFAGIPYVVLGQNRDIVWGATTNFMDVTDTFQEKVVSDPVSPSGLSIVHDGEWEPILPLPQEFKYNKIEDGVDNLVSVPPGSVIDGVYIPPAVLIVPRRNYGPIVVLNEGEGFALSIQYTGFSATREVDAFRMIDLSGDLEDFAGALRHFDVGSQNFAFADKHGNIAYFATAELPLREDLEAGFVNGLPPFFIRNGEGGNEWPPMHKRQKGQAVDYEILPEQEMPRLLNPSKGFFVNANNDPIGATFDNNPLNQLRPSGGLLYFSPSYHIGLRAGLITRRLKDMIAAGPVGTEDMKELQASVEMPDARFFTPFIAQAHQNGDALAALGPAGAHPNIALAVGRLALWDFTAPTGVLEGYDGGDVDGSLQAPTEIEIADSVAATIYAVWRARMIANTIDAQLMPRGLAVPDDQPVMTALKHLFDSFDTNHGVGESGIDFFPLPGIADPATRRDIFVLKSLIEALDLLKGPEFGAAFGESADLGDYRWGRLHRLVLGHPLGGPFDIPSPFSFPPSFDDLPGIAVDGGFMVIDRSDHDVRAQSSDGFMFSHGPARRYVGAVGRVRDDIRGESSLPGGVSGVFGAYHANLLAPWLTNDTYGVLRSEAAVAADTVEELIFMP